MAAAGGPLEDKLGWLEDTLGWLEDKLYLQLAKRRYDEQLAKRPRRIILVRHGQSQGNVDDKVYATVPDSQIALTERGFAQAVVAGLQIRSLVGDAQGGGERAQAHPRLILVDHRRLTHHAL